MSLIALGINHKTASLAVREKVAFADHELGEIMAELAEALHQSEVAVLSTCNRVEFYVFSDQQTPEQLREQLLHWLQVYSSA